MSLIDQALQKAYQQRARVSGNASVTNEETAGKDRRPQATRELYLHKPQVPIRSHFSTANSVQRTTRRAAETMSPNAWPATPEMTKPAPEAETTSPSIDSKFATPESPKEEKPAVSVASVVVDRPVSIEPKEETSFPAFHFHVTTQDTLAVDDAIYFVAGESESPMQDTILPSLVAEAPSAAVPVPVIEREAPLATPPAPIAIPEPAPARLEEAPPELEVAPSVSPSVEPFQVAWEVDEFQMPWACEQAEAALATELLAAVRDLPRHDSQVFWVSSLLSGEGRTSIATLLSYLLAKSGHQVLLVQGDWQAPSLAQRMGVALEAGWSPAEPFTSSGLADVCVRSVRENFTILPAGNQAGAQRVVSMEPIVELIRQMLPHFPTIVIDAPVGFGHRRVAIPETHETEILVQDVRKTPKQAIAQILDNVPSLRSRSVRIVQNFVPAIGVAASR